jgi:hypothetical protein
MTPRVGQAGTNKQTHPRHEKEKKGRKELTRSDQVSKACREERRTGQGRAAESGEAMIGWKRGGEFVADFSQKALSVVRVILFIISFLGAHLTGCSSLHLEMD